MKAVVYESLGLDVSILVPETVAEYDLLAKRPDAALGDAIDNTVYRGVLNQVRAAFVPALVAFSGIKPHSKTVKDKTGKDVEEITESDKKYVDRVVAEIAVRDSITEEAARATLQPLMDQVLKATDEKGVPKISFDPSSTPRAAAVKKPTKESLAIVAQLRAAGKWDAAAVKFSTELGANLPTTDDELGLLIAESLRRKRAAEAAAQQTALLASV